MAEPPVGPIAGGVRVDYGALPPPLRRWVESELRGPVVEAVTQPGGFSPGVAARLRTAAGDRAFLKAVSAAANPETPDLHRREAAVTAALPAHAPAARLLASYDAEGWVALLLSDIDGRHPHLPWRPDDLRRVVDALDDLHDALTPAPLADAGEAAVVHAELFGNWSLLAADPPAGLDDWARRHVDELAWLEAGWAEALAGDTLLHFDTRADNILLTAEQVWFVDWPWAARGNAVFDLVGMAPSVTMQGGPPPEDVLRLSRHGRAADEDVVTTLVASITGYLAHRALQPAPAGLPTLRAFQRAQGTVALRWLAARTGWR
jgi:hypothetical protein